MTWRRIFCYPSLTYAQKPGCGTAQPFGFREPCYKTHSCRKSLISLDFFSCPFSGHSSETLESAGFAVVPAGLSTKLSTQIAALAQFT
jgi:hypothetical protein